MGVLDRFKNSWLLFKTSLAFLKRDKSLLAVPVLLPFVNLLTFALFAVIAISIWFSIPTPEARWQLTLWGIVFSALFLFLMSLVNTFFGAAQSWMVYEVAKGQDATLGSGVRRAMHNIGDVLLFALAMTAIHLLTAALRGKRQGQGIDVGYQVRSMFAGWIETLTGILGKLVLPAMIVTERTFGEAVADLKRSIKAWPEILALEIGIGPVMGVAFFLGSLIIAVITLLLFPLSAMVAIITAIVLAVLLILTLNIFGTFINATYYTLLYLALIEKKHIKNVEDVFYRRI